MWTEPVGPWGKAGKDSAAAAAELRIPCPQGYFETVLSEPMTAQHRWDFFCTLSVNLLAAIPIRGLIDDGGHRRPYSRWTAILVRLPVDLLLWILPKVV